MKRFTETIKWSDPWFRSLSIESKCLWLWLLDNCDCAGIIEPDMGLAAFQIGTTCDLQGSLQALGDRVEIHGSKLFIPKFIRYQYGQELNIANTAHRGVVRRLESSKILCPVTISGNTIKEPIKPLESPLQGAQDKDKDKDKDKDLLELAIKKKKDKPTIDELRVFCKSIQLEESDGDWVFDKWEGNGWKNDGRPIVSWQSTIRSWKRIGTIFPSQKAKQSKPNGSTHNDRHHGETEILEIPML